LIEVQDSELNVQAYNEPAVVHHYASLDYVTACERLLFDRYIQPSMSVLDLGVGGGRTTSDLSRRASRYVGLDCAEEMVQVCRQKFPEIEFRQADACDLSQFTGSSFDAVVFSFNGIDCFTTTAKRLQCLQECNRILRDGGVFIFSTHNPRAIFVQPAWNQDKVRQFAMRMAGANSAILPFAVSVVTLLKAVHASARALAWSLARMPRISTSAFWCGEGYIQERVHGRLAVHHAVPAHVTRELTSCNFRFCEAVGNDYPRKAGAYFTHWYYYVFMKADADSGRTLADRRS
jgi:ubiquinone/menaquinone biosynthesis C-methylase UbiE